ncbi:MAG: hypothetical protein O7G30_05415, partial [Proteobacteria bacterium]|nr:hypothetical protein [Pseudomonadota bacterium]
MSLGGGVQYISNVFRNQENIQEDFKFGVAPSLSISNTRRRLNWNFKYEPRYTSFVEFDQRNEWTHAISLRGDYSFSPRTRLAVFDSFHLQSFDSARSFNEANPDVTPDDQQDQRKTLRNRLLVSLSHQIGRRLSSSASFGYSVARFDNPRDADRDT